MQALKKGDALGEIAHTDWRTQSCGQCSKRLLGIFNSHSLSGWGVSLTKQVDMISVRRVCVSRFVCIKFECLMNSSLCKCT